MSLNALADFISRVGFPIAVAIWLLWREDRYRTYLHEHEDREREMLDQLIDKHIKARSPHVRWRSR